MGGGGGGGGLKGRKLKGATIEGSRNLKGIKYLQREVIQVLKNL